MSSDHCAPPAQTQTPAGIRRRTLLRTAAATATPLLMANTVTAADEHTTTAETSAAVEQLHGTALLAAAAHAALDPRTQRLLRHFHRQGFTPRLQALSGVKATDPETGDTGRVVIVPFATGDDAEQAWIQHSTVTDAQPAPVTGIHTVHHDPGPETEAYWDVTRFQVVEGDVRETADRVQNLFGCPNDKVNPEGLTKLAADYAVTFVSCAACVGSSSALVPACAVCVAQIARMGVSIDDYNWCECDPTANC